MIKKVKEDKQFGKGDWSYFFKLIPYVKLPWLIIVVAFLFNLFGSEMQTRVPVSNAALMAGEFTSKALIEAILVNFISFALIIVESFALTLATSMAVKKTQSCMWKKMLKLKMEYYDDNNPNDMFSIITNDTETAVTAIVSQIVTIIPSLYYIFRVFATLKSYDNRLVLSLFVLVPVNVIFVIVLGRWKYEVNKNIFTRIGGLTAYLAERVSNISLIRAYTNEKQELSRGLKASRDLYDAYMDNAKVTLVSETVSNIIDILQRCVPIVIGAVLLRNGAITMQQWIVFFMFVSQVISQINSLISIWVSIKSAQGSASRMVELFKAEEVEDISSAKDFINGDIVFENVDFAYGDIMALKNISVTIPAGKTTAIVGKCGSGKTTLMSLIERLYVPKSGRIKIAEQDINCYSLESYRDNFAYVQQNAGIFSGSLKECLTYGIKEEIGCEKILEACRATGLDKYVKNNAGGLEGEISIGGSSLSGGQRQRIVLARELLKNKDILLLDEPTSALDAKSKYDIQCMLFNLFKGKTLVMITHDINLLSCVDNVILMDDGIVVANGSHKVLLQTNEEYRKLIETNESLEVE